MKYYYRLGIVSALVFSCCVLPIILIYFLGYNNENEWNLNSVETNCTIKETIIITNECEYDCYCYKNNNIKECEKCYYSCYSGYVLLEYLNNITNKLLIYFEVENENILAEKLYYEYPINNTIVCYYNNSNIYDLKLSKNDLSGYITGMITTFIIGIFIIIGWGIKEFIMFKKHKKYYEIVGY